MKLEGNVLIAQGGGPTAVINQSLAGLILEARKYPEIQNIYGSVNGIEGIVREHFINLSNESNEKIEEVSNAPSSALLSSRMKPDEAYCKEIFRVFQTHNIRYFFYIGGNDSADTVRIVNQQADLAGYDLRAIHVPKTIDNDLVVNDHTPGYGSAARFVAQAFTGLNLDSASLPRVHIGVVMGRNAGFLTAASSMAQNYPDDGPHLIYLPERTFYVDDFLKDVNKVYEKYGRCLIAVSEGIQDENGIPIAAKLIGEEKDAHGNCQLSGTGALGDLLANYVKEHLNVKTVRSDTLGYLQRSFTGCVSDVDRKEAREVGKRAVRYAVEAELDGSVVIDRTGDYQTVFRIVPLEDIAAKTKYMPDHFINEEGNHITEAFKDYVRPLMGGDLPRYSRFEIPKK